MDMVYLDNASTSMVPDRVLRVTEQFTSLYRGDGIDTHKMYETQQDCLNRTRKKVAEFIHCSEKEIALMQSTSHCLGTLASVLPLKAGDNIVMCDLEYQASVVGWLNRQKEVGFEIRLVETRGGTVSADDFRKYVDKHTKVILLAAVQEINGFRADVKEIGKLAREYGCYYIVDGIQEIGAFQVDVKDLNVDVYCAGGKKWLCNPFGMGFLYIHERCLNELKPLYFSYSDIQTPAGYDTYVTYLEDPRRHPADMFALKEGAIAFENGGYANYLGAMGLYESISMLQELGMDRVQEHIRRLNCLLRAGLHEAGVHISGSEEEKNLSSIVSFNFGLKDNSVEKERRLIRFLHERNIFVSLRCSTGEGGIRVSMHFYTREEEIRTFLAALTEFMAQDR